MMMSLVIYVRYATITMEASLNAFDAFCSPSAAITYKEIQVGQGSERY